jgi:hypothetical protein
MTSRHRNTDLSGGLKDEQTMLALVQRIQSFDYENATPDDNLVLVKALKTVAHDTVARWQHVHELQHLAEQRLGAITFSKELNEVCAVLGQKPSRTRALTRWLW